MRTQTNETDVAVVGGGMFGVASAIKLAEAGMAVTLFERQEDLLSATSGSNHWRLHRGYHYPLSDSTAREALAAEPAFREYFEEAVVSDETHYYAIADESRVNYAEYAEFMDRHGLEYEPVDLDLVNRDRMETVIEVEENHVDVDTLRGICHAALERHDVVTHLGTEVASVDELRDYDYTVVAAYGANNAVLPATHDLRRQYRFEVCEVPIVEMPDRYLGNNILVVYGPFMSVDHWGATDTFVMGDYHHMRHHSNVGYEPEVPGRFEGVVNAGPVADSELSNFDRFRWHGAMYIPGVGESRHVSSMYTIRTILPDVGDTDARPTRIERSGDVVCVFGGKLATAVETGERVLAELRRAP